MLPTTPQMLDPKHDPPKQPQCCNPPVVEILDGGSKRSPGIFGGAVGRETATHDRLGDDADLEDAVAIQQNHLQIMPQLRT